MNFKQYQESPEVLLSLYKSLVKPRMIEEKMLVLLRQGKVSKWFSGIGQEAIAVGLTSALAEREYIFPLHRNLGVFTTRKMPLGRLFAQLQGKYEGYSKGRERSFHFGAKEHHIVGMISHLGPQLTLANGAALASLLEGQPQVAAAFTGDGGTSEGDFHEALNVAAVWQLPVIFVIENNGYGLSTPTSEQYRCNSFIDKGVGYGMEAIQIDGNNILEVYQTVKKLADDMRVNPRPILLECMTFRMRGHEEASGTKYVPQELFDIWSKKDPVVNFEQYLLEEKILDQSLIELIRSQVKSEIDEGLNFAFALPEPDNSVEEELGDVYAPWQQTLTAPSSSTSDKRLCDAISDGLKLAMEKHHDLVLMGQDIAEYGGVFKITEGFVEQFGKGRVRNTPLCESAILGCGLGLSISGKKAMVEMQFADFVTSGFNQIVNNLAKMHYRWGQHADVVVRMPTGAGVGAGPFHSQSNEAWFVHTPGLKVVYPSNPVDAKGLLLAAFEDPNPYLFFEHKALYRSLSAAVPDGYYTLPIGKAVVAQKGNDVTVVTYGLGVHWALEAAQEHGEGEIEVIDLRTLLPWDKETVFESVKKTGRVMVMHEDCQTGGIGGEIAATIAEECFQFLDAPVSRHGSLDTPVPFSPALENKFLGKNRFKRKLKDLLAY